MLKLFFACVTGMAILFGMPAGLSAQAQESTSTAETVTRTPGFITDPVKIVRILYNGKPIESGIPFQGDEEWLKGISIEAENISHKTLVYATVQIVFRSLGHPLLSAFAEVGQLPEHRRNATDGTVYPDSREPIAIKPGEKFIIPFQPAFAQAKTIVSGRAKLSDVHQCSVTLARAYFDGGYMWQLRDFFKETRDATNHYDRSTPEDFYGTDLGTIRN
jgi:hypothetical protein